MFCFSHSCVACSLFRIIQFQFDSEQIFFIDSISCVSCFRVWVSSFCLSSIWFSAFQTFENFPCKLFSSHLVQYQCKDAYFESIGISFTSSFRRNHATTPRTHCIEWSLFQYPQLVSCNEGSSLPRQTDFEIWAPWGWTTVSIRSPNQQRFLKYQQKQFTNLLTLLSLLFNFLPFLIRWPLSVLFSLAWIWTNNFCFSKLLNVVCILGLHSGEFFSAHSEWKRLSVSDVRSVLFLHQF